MASSALSKQEVRRLIHIAKTGGSNSTAQSGRGDTSTRNSLIVVLGLYTAMRAKEIASLLVKDCYKADGTPKQEFNLDLKRTKTKRSRTVDIGNPVIQKALVRYWNDKGMKKPDQPLIEGQRGKKNMTWLTLSQSVCLSFVCIYKFFDIVWLSAAIQ